jgi:curved DNA-binding protein CbpA
MIIPAGDVKDMTIPWLFQSLRAEKKTGTVIFSREAAIKKVYFQNGDVIFAFSNLEGDRLGDFLLRSNKLTRAQFDASSELTVKTGKKLGAILVELGFVAPQDLVSGVKEQVKQIILSLFTWRDGRYIFDDSPLPASDIIPLQMSIGNLIIEGIRGQDWQLVRKSLPPLKTKLLPAADPSFLFQGADLDQDQQSILPLIDGNRSIEELCSLSGLGDFNTLKAIYALLALKMADKGAAKTEQEMKSARMAMQEAAAAEQRKTAASGPGEQEPETAEQAAPVVTRQMIQEALAAMKNQDHYQVLGIRKSATPQELKKAYFRLAKIYHPDRHFEAEMSDLKETLEMLFAGIHTAYQTLSDPVQRQNYDLGPAEKPATAQYEEKRPEEYVENYTEKAGQAAAYFKAGIQDFSIGNFWGAAESFAWATRLDPVKSDYYYHYGISLTHIPRRRHEAEENLKKAIEIDPLRPEYHLELGTLYLKSGLKTKALDVYNDALRHNPASGKLMEAIKAAAGTAQDEKEGESGLVKKMSKDKK